MEFLKDIGSSRQRKLHRQLEGVYPNRERMKRWSGTTSLEIKAGFDALAPKRKEPVEPPDPTNRPKKRTTSRGRSSATAAPATTTESTQEASSGFSRPLTTAAAMTTESTQEASLGSIDKVVSGAQGRQGSPEVFHMEESEAIHDISEHTLLGEEAHRDDREREGEHHHAEPTAHGAAPHKTGGEVLA